MPNSTLNPTFPQKLFFLMDLECSDIIVWLPHGLAFKVLDYKRFSDETIPKYFRHTKLTSFQRQLNLYGFRRITKGEDQGAYFHSKFQRGRADLVAEIRRLPGKPLITGFDNNMNDLSSSENSSEMQVGASKRSLSGDMSADNMTSHRRIDSTQSYEELKSMPNQLHTQHYMDSNDHTYPASKMSKVSANVGYGRNNGGDVQGEIPRQSNYPGNIYIRWIPVATSLPIGMEAPNGGRNDFNSIQNFPLDMSMVEPMVNNFPHSFLYKEMLGAPESCPSYVSSGSGGESDHTTSSTASGSSCSITSGENDWSSWQSHHSINISNTGIPDESNFTCDFDLLCGDIDDDNLLDVATVECLQDLLSC